MAVKVLVERRIRAGFEEDVLALLRELREEAVRTRGYLYSETWREVGNPRVVVSLSVWSSLEHWQRWESDEFRQRLVQRINRMLRRPATVRVFQDAV